MRVERLVPCPPKHFWWALVKNAELAQHAVILRLTLPDGIGVATAAVTRYESKTLLACWSDGDLLRWELQPRGEFTHVTFTCGQDAEQWIGCLDSLIDQTTTGRAMTPLSPNEASNSDMRTSIR